MIYWDIDIYLEGNRYCTVKLPKLSPTEVATDVVKRICGIAFPIFENSNDTFTVVNTQKIVEIDMKEVNIDEEATHCSDLYGHCPGQHDDTDGM